ncbi:hypothetical protein HW555_011436 [Spodoptera exigua]|uniref:Uncharacterized protein n=1 Tax=Spodoptera exigua TaxID=7107 RepID=A0A835G5D9_SPOEX|nr:hypothetical protein HW555_011436 [Spodoptera exigua]
MVAVVATVAARPQHGHPQKYKHGHVFFPQNMLLHQSHNDKHNTGHLENHEDHVQDEYHQAGHQRLHRDHHYPGHQHKKPHYQDRLFEEHTDQQPSSQTSKQHNEKETEKHVMNMQPEFDLLVGNPYADDKKSQNHACNREVVRNVFIMHQPDKPVRISEFHSDKKIDCVFKIRP